MAVIGFIGLGNMGAPMARNLLEAGHVLKVFDVARPAVEALAGTRAYAADSAAAAVEGVEFVISMLPGDRESAALYLEEDELLAQSPAGALIIDCTTVSPKMARRLAEAGRQAGRAVLDAPVSGGVAGAQAARLTFMAGGAQADFARARPILSAMGRNMFLAGGPGAGAGAKLCNNLLLAIQMIGVCEALRLGGKAGLEAGTLSGIMLQSSGRNWVLELYNPCPGVMESAPASHDFAPGFMSRLMLKDLELALRTAQDAGAAAPLGEAARALYAAHCAAGGAELDFSSIINFSQSPAPKSLT